MKCEDLFSDRQWKVCHAYATFVTQRTKTGQKVNIFLIWPWDKAQLIIDCVIGWLLLCCPWFGDHICRLWQMVHKTAVIYLYMNFIHEFVMMQSAVRTRYNRKQRAPIRLKTDRRHLCLPELHVSHEWLQNSPAVSLRPPLSSRPQCGCLAHTRGLVLHSDQPEWTTWAGPKLQLSVQLY